MGELAAVYCGFLVPSQVTEEVAKLSKLKPKERFPKLLTGSTCQEFDVSELEVQWNSESHFL